MRNDFLGILLKDALLSVCNRNCAAVLLLSATLRH
jgi:hypothetical protein